MRFFSETYSKPVWQDRRRAVVILLAAAAPCAWLWRFPPAPGYAIAVLGAVAAVMSIREMGQRERFVWLLVVFSLLYLEHSYTYRQRHDRA